MVLNNLLLNNAINVVVENKPQTFIEWLLNPNTLVALTAIAISILGLCISVRYNRETLEETVNYNKLSVEPLLDVFRSIIDENIKVFVNNYGLGTAKVISFDLIYKGEGYSDFQELMKECEVTGISSWHYYSFEENEPIPAGGKVEVLNVAFNTSGMFEKVNNIFKDVEIRMCYQTMYGEERELKKSLYPDGTIKKLQDANSTVSNYLI